MPSDSLLDNRSDGERRAPHGLRARVRYLRRLWRAKVWPGPEAWRWARLSLLAIGVALAIVGIVAALRPANRALVDTRAQIVTIACHGHKSMLTIRWASQGYLDAWNIAQVHGPYRANKQNPNGATVHSWGNTLIVRFPKSAPVGDYEIKLLSARQSANAVIQVGPGGFGVWE